MKSVALPLAQPKSLQSKASLAERAGKRDGPDATSVVLGGSAEIAQLIVTAADYDRGNYLNVFLA